MLLRPAEKILVNSLSATTVTAISGGVNVQGYGDILTSEILEAYCTCAADCVPQASVVCITIPDSCECPYEWPLTIRNIPCPNKYEVQTTFSTPKYYGYQNPSGATPTANETATAVADYINEDPNAIVTATVGTYNAATGAFTPNTSGTCLLLTEKDCLNTCGFQVYTDSGSIYTVPVANVANNITLHTNAILSSEDMFKLFPIQWGQQGSRPNLPYCGTYCKYHFKLRKACDVQDISQANAFNCYEQEVDFYVDSSLSNYVDDWETEMHAAFSQLDCELPT